MFYGELTLIQLIENNSRYIKIKADRNILQLDWVNGRIQTMLKNFFMP